MDFVRQNKLLAGVLFVVVAALIFVFAHSKGWAADKNGRSVTSQTVFADAPVAKINWTGVYVGLHGGYNAASFDISVPGSALDGLSARGLSGGIDGGADVQMPGGCIVLGARGGYTLGDVKFTAGPMAVKLQDGWNADGRIGCAVGTALPYLFAGYTQVNTSAPVGITLGELKGWRTGGGIEFLLPTSVSATGFRPTLALEYIHTDFNDVKLGGVVNVNPTEESVMMRLNLRFGG